MNDVNRKMAAGIAWMSMMRVGVKGLSLISTIALARLLAPGDFGLIAMAMSVISALDLIRAFNFDLALIHRQNTDRTYYDTAWTFNISFSFALAVILLCIAPVATIFFKEPRLLAVMRWLALSVFISGFENIGVVAFRKELVFHKEFVLRIVQKACGIAVTVPLAFALRNYWALVIGAVSDSLLAVVISYLAHPFRPRLSLKASKHLFSFSKWLVATNSIWFLRDRVPDYVLGRVAGTSALGLFSLSVEISNLPTSELIAPMNRAVFPAYAKMAHDLKELQQGFLNVIGLILLVALPAGFGISATSELIVDVVLGTKWEAAVPAISILAIYGSINAMQTNCGAIHYAMSRPRTVAVMGAIHAALVLPLVIVGAYRYGAIGVAWVYLIAAIIVVPLNYYVVLRRLHLAMRTVCNLLWRPAVATAIMYTVTHEWIAARPSRTLPALLAAILIGVVTYGAALAALWLVSGRPIGPERTLTNRLLVPAWSRLSARWARGAA